MEKSDNPNNNMNQSEYLRFWDGYSGTVGKSRQYTYHIAQYNNRWLLLLHAQGYQPQISVHPSPEEAFEYLYLSTTDLKSTVH